LWFKESEIHHLEHKALPQFFLGNPGRSPEYYKYMRNAIITLCKQHPHLYISASECLNHVSGDCCDIIRVHSFLEHWGLINFTSDLMNQQTQKIFPMNSTNVLRGSKELKEIELEEDWEKKLSNILFRQEFKEFDKFEGINWIRREISKVAGLHRPKLNTKNDVINEVIAWIKRKKGLKCDCCGKLLGEWFYTDRQAVSQIIEKAIALKNEESEINESLKQRFHKSVKPCEKITRKIIKQEKDCVKWCSKCYDDKLFVKSPGSFKKESQMETNLMKMSLGQIIKDYSEFIAVDKSENESIKESLKKKIPRNLFKKKILKLINEFGCQFGRVLERVKPEERKDFLMNYLEISLKDLKGLKGILRNNFDFFHRITTDMNRNNSLQGLKGFRHVQSILKQEENLKQVDELINAYVESCEVKLESSDQKKESAKRDYDEMNGTDNHVEENPMAKSITKMIKRRANEAKKVQKEKIIKTLNQYIYLQLSKIKKKINSIEDYEKFLMHEDVILRIKQNQYLTRKFMENINK
jgi:hypothetical protein